MFREYQEEMRRCPMKRCKRWDIVGILRDIEASENRFERGDMPTK